MNHKSLFLIIILATFLSLNIKLKFLLIETFDQYVDNSTNKYVEKDVTKTVNPSKITNEVDYSSEIILKKKKKKSKGRKCIRKCELKYKRRIKKFRRCKNKCKSKYSKGKWKPIMPPFTLQERMRLGTENLNCQYYCDNWPYQDCKHMGYRENQWGHYIKDYGVCIAKYWIDGNIRLNYPNCGGLPKGCITTCDNYCHSTIKEKETNEIISKNTCSYNCTGWPYRYCSQIYLKQERLLQIIQITSPHTENNTSVHFIDRGIGTKHEKRTSHCFPKLYKSGGILFQHSNFLHCGEVLAPCQTCWSYCDKQMVHD